MMIFHVQPNTYDLRCAAGRGFVAGAVCRVSWWLFWLSAFCQAWLMPKCGVVVVWDDTTTEMEIIYVSFIF